MSQKATVLVAIVLIVAAITTVSQGHDNPRRAKKPDVGFLATTHDVVDEILRQTRVTKDDVVCDLGCGDGRIVITAATTYGCRSVGYEIDAALVQTARERAEKAGVAARTEIHEQDIFTADLSHVTVVTLFLLPELNARLIPQLERLPRTARIVSHEFEIPGLKADRQVTFHSKEDDSEHLLYFYSLPLRQATR